MATRTRFTEIFQNNTPQESTIPIGCQAKNVVLEDGSILEQALGDINFQENGSIIDQIKEAKNKGDGYAPINSPFFERGLFLKRYASTGENKLLTLKPQSSITARGVTLTYNANTLFWTLNGSSISPGEEVRIFMYGKGTPETKIINENSYTFEITRNTLLNDFFQLGFSLYNQVSEETSYNTITEEGENFSYNFTIQSNQVLTGIYLLLPGSSQSIEIGGQQFQVAFTETSENNNLIDRYHTVFDIQQSSSTKAWTTTISENLVVNKGLQDKARSTLGTIYDTEWEGILNINPSLNECPNILLQNGKIKFKFNNSAEDFNINSATEQGKNILNYDSATQHQFKILGVPQLNILSNKIQTATNTDVEIKKDLIVDGNFQNANTPKYIFFDTMKKLEQRIHGDDTNFPINTPVIVCLNGPIAGYFTQGGIGRFNLKGYGYAYRPSKYTALFFYYCNSSFYKTQYGWGSDSNYQVTNSRYVTTWKIDFQNKVINIKNGRNFWTWGT